MRLFALGDILLRAPDAPVATAAVETVVPAGPLTVAPAEAPAVVEAAPAAPGVEAAPSAPAAEAAAIAPQEIRISEGLLAGAPSRADLKAALVPPNGSPAPADGGAAALGAAPAKDAPVEPQPQAKKPTSYDAFKAPAGAALIDEYVKRFTDTLSAGDDPVSQEKAQKLIDLHFELKKLAVAEKERESRVYWAGLQDKWREEVRTDPKLGKSLEYNLAVAKAVIEDYAASKADEAAIWQQMAANGFHNFPPFIRFLHKLGSPDVLNVFEDSIVPAAAPIGNAVKTRAERWYSGNGNQAAP
jgi:hypothetical protein